MALTRLTLTDFRNHADTRLSPGAGFNVLVGENGSGKTNVLETISMLVPGRGLRGAALPEMARQDGPGGFGVSGRVNENELSTGALAGAPERRVVRINGATRPAITLGEYLSVMWITPAMDRLWTDPASERRRFLDRMVLAVEPGHARHASRYDAAMRQRNRLLAQDEPADAHWLTALETQMAEHGAELHRARVSLVAALGERLAGADDAPFARPVLALAGYDPTGDLAALLAQSRARDAAAGRTLTGPHRIDLAVTHAAKAQPAASCSTGEQKALLFSTVLAHAALVADRRGQRPLLLLDEVTAHLDVRRREALFAHLAAAGGQVWMTGTEAELFDGLGSDAARFRLESGTLISPSPEVEGLSGSVRRF
jgi:DNA replication and repair protein RecF